MSILIHIGRLSQLHGERRSLESNLKLKSAPLAGTFGGENWYLDT